MRALFKNLSERFTGPERQLIDHRQWMHCAFLLATPQLYGMIMYPN